MDMADALRSPLLLAAKCAGAGDIGEAKPTLRELQAPTRLPWHRVPSLDRLDLEKSSHFIITCGPHRVWATSFNWREEDATGTFLPVVPSVCRPLGQRFAVVSIKSDLLEDVDGADTRSNSSIMQESNCVSLGTSAISHESLQPTFIRNMAAIHEVHGAFSGQFEARQQAERIALSAPKPTTSVCVVPMHEFLSISSDMETKYRVSATLDTAHALGQRTAPVGISDARRTSGFRTLDVLKTLGQDEKSKHEHRRGEAPARKRAGDVRGGRGTRRQGKKQAEYSRAEILELNRQLIDFENEARKDMLEDRAKDVPVPRHICATIARKLRHDAGQESYYDHAKHWTQFQQTIEGRRSELLSALTHIQRKQTNRASQ